MTQCGVLLVSRVGKGLFFFYRSSASSEEFLLTVSDYETRPQEIALEWDRSGTW